MAWEDQGRQWPMWFGHGTSGNDPSKAARDVATQVAYSALAQLPASQSGPYEGWLNRSGLDLLNRLHRNNESNVTQVCGGYAHLMPDLLRAAPDDRTAW